MAFGRRPFSRRLTGAADLATHQEDTEQQNGQGDDLDDVIAKMLATDGPVIAAICIEKEENCVSCCFRHMYGI